MAGSGAGWIEVRVANVRYIAEIGVVSADAYVDKRDSFPVPS